MTFKVYSPLHVKFAATILVEQLIKLGNQATWVDGIIASDEEIYIIYNAAGIEVFPKNYIVYQTEIHGSHWFKEQYRETIKNALCVWEYSEANRVSYNHDKIAIVTPGIKIQPPVKKDIPVLFYGWLKDSARRVRILNRIKQRVKVMVVTNTMGVEMEALLARTRIVLNIHYYDRSPLEVFRLNEALSYGCHVVTEYSRHDDERYNGLVAFCSTPHLDLLLKNLSRVDFNVDISSLDNLEEVRSGLMLL